MMILLQKRVTATKKFRARRKPIDEVVIVKTLMVVARYGLSDCPINYQVPDRHVMTQRKFAHVVEKRIAMGMTMDDSIRRATRAISDWISFYGHKRPH